MYNTIPLYLCVVSIVIILPFLNLISGKIIFNSMFHKQRPPGLAEPYFSSNFCHPEILAVLARNEVTRENKILILKAVKLAALVTAKLSWQSGMDEKLNIAKGTMDPRVACSQQSNLIILSHIASLSKFSFKILTMNF